MIVVPTPTAQAETRGNVTDDVDLRETRQSSAYVCLLNKTTNKTKYLAVEIEKKKNPGPFYKIM